jgi:hypothetical protein
MKILGYIIVFIGLAVAASIGKIQTWGKIGPKGIIKKILIFLVGLIISWSGVFLVRGDWDW